MIKAQISKSLKSNLIKLSKEFDLDLFILFGSRAQGTSKENSDYDFAYYKQKPLTNSKEKKLFDKIFEIINYQKFDLIIISEETPPILKIEIFKQGIPIFKKNNKIFEIIKENAYIEYIDSKVLLEPHKEAYLNQEI